MKYYKDENGNVFAYEADGSQDHLIGAQVLMTDAEVEAHLNPQPTIEQWRSTATCESAKLKYVLADSYAILDDIEAVISQQDGKVRSMWIFTKWSRNNQALIGMVTQMSQAIPDVKAVVDGAGGVDAFMDAWFKAGIDLIV